MPGNGCPPRVAAPASLHGFHQLSRAYSVGKPRKILDLGREWSADRRVPYPRKAPERDSPGRRIWPPYSPPDRFRRSGSAFFQYPWRIASFRLRFQNEWITKIHKQFRARPLRKSSRPTSGREEPAVRFCREKSLFLSPVNPEPMTRLPLRAVSVLLLSALMLPGCSSVKPMLSGSERERAGKIYEGNARAYRKPCARKLCPMSRSRSAT